MRSRRALRHLPSSFSPREWEGSLDAKGLRLAIVCARWNSTVTEAMLEAALGALGRHGARTADVKVVRVPGAFELPAAAQAVMESEKPDAVIALAAIVRGETSHHEVLAHAVASALASLTVKTGVPVGFGLLTCDSMEQARQRTGKGVEAAEAAVELANLKRVLRRK